MESLVIKLRSLSHFHLFTDEGNVIEKNKVWEVQENIAAALQEYEEGKTPLGI